jgi:hypothetical protein
VLQQAYVSCRTIEEPSIMSKKMKPYYLHLGNNTVDFECEPSALNPLSVLSAFQRLCNTPHNL